MENVDEEMDIEKKKNKNTENHLTSAAAFVDGGIQDPCDDACSICLEEFSENDPSSITICKHEFHLQCILEWCQRSSQCPMCWQPIGLKDPSSQELLEAVERERNFRVAPPRNTTIFRHPTLGDFELQHLPSGVNDEELEERIIQHLAAAAAMGRAHHTRRRETQRGRSSAHGRPHYLVFSTHPGDDHPPGGGNAEPAAVSVAAPSTPITFSGGGGGDETPPRNSHAPFVQSNQNSPSSSGSNLVQPSRSFMSRNSINQSQPSPDRAGPSDLQSFSDALKSKFSAMSTRYKESFSKSTRGWKERLFSRSGSVTDSGSEARREVNEGIASVSRMVERLETGDHNDRTSRASVSDILPNGNDEARSSHRQSSVNNNNNSNAHTSVTASSASC